jgi:hypothetical protein
VGAGWIPELAGPGTALKKSARKASEAKKEKIFLIANSFPGITRVRSFLDE